MSESEHGFATESGTAYIEAYARPGSRITDSQARIVFRELKKLPTEHRTAADVAEVAKDPENPMHNIVYDVSEDVAATRYYRQRARHVMASVNVRIIREEEVTERPAFFAVTVAPPVENRQAPKSYVLYSEVQERDAWKEEILTRVQNDVQVFRNRYIRYQNILLDVDPELADLLSQADDYLAKGSE